MNKVQGIIMGIVASASVAVFGATFVQAQSSVHVPVSGVSGLSVSPPAITIQVRGGVGSATFPVDSDLATNVSNFVSSLDGAEYDTGIIHSSFEAADVEKTTIERAFDTAGVQMSSVKNLPDFD